MAMHHAHTDKEGDPHHSRDGRWWSHVGWILTGTAQQHDEATMRTTFLICARIVRIFCSDRFYFPSFDCVGAGATSVWRLERYVVGASSPPRPLALHATWLVNSATHLWGRKRFETGDDSRNSWWVAMLTFGEGCTTITTRTNLGRSWAEGYEVHFNWWGIQHALHSRLPRYQTSSLQQTRHHVALVTGDRKTKGSLEELKARLRVCVPPGSKECDS